MRSLTAIFTWLLWRFHPVLWMHSVIDRLFDWAFDTLEAEFDRLCQSREVLAWFGGWLVVIGERLDELIEMKACQIAGLDHQPWPRPRHSWAWSVRLPHEACRRLERLVLRYQDMDRLAQRRAQRLLRQREVDTVDLSPSAHAAVLAPAPPVLPVWSVVSRFAKCAAERIRAPPWPSPSENPSNPTRWRRLRERERASAQTIEPSAQPVMVPANRSEVPQ
jgi:hypothetical protein